MATLVAPRQRTETTADPSSPAEARPLGPGSVLGRYELQRPLASGGMAQVWVATQSGALGFRKTVALKTIRPDRAHDATFREMFLDEARLASRIHHANVVEVFDLGVEGSVVFQAMPLVSGAALSVLLRGTKTGRMPLALALRVVLDMLRGLRAAHELCDDHGVKLGLIHRDVSPQNLLVGTDGVAKLSDFGIAKAFGRIAHETDAGAVRGKVRYLAPELLAGGLPPSPQSDLFACGVVLWELIAGVPLFQASSSTELFELRREAPLLRDPREVVPALPESLCAIVMKALATDPFARFASAREMAEAIEVLVHEHSLRSTQEELGDWVTTTVEGRAPIASEVDAAPTTTTTRANEQPTVRTIPTQTEDPSTMTVVAVEPETTTFPSIAVPIARASRRPLLAALAVLPLIAGIAYWRSSGPPAPEETPANVAPPPASMALPAPTASVVEPAASAPPPAPATTALPPPRHRPAKKSKPAPSTAPEATGATPVFRSPY